MSRNRIGISLMTQHLREEQFRAIGLRRAEEVRRRRGLDVRPSSMKITRSATVRAKPISCVTTIMVIPSRASSTITSSTSLIISGSSAEVGSSKSISFGFMQSARAIATRCCWPPESCEGYLCACSRMRTRARKCIAVSSASFVETRFTQIGASVKFCSTVRCGKRLKLWNTMPTSPHHVGLLHVVGELDAVDHDLSALMLLQAVHQANERGLAGAGWPANHDLLAARHREVDVLQHMERGEVLVHLDHLDHRWRTSKLLL